MIRLHVWHDFCMCVIDMTGWYVWHALFLFWLVHNKDQVDTLYASRVRIYSLCETRHLLSINSRLLSIQCETRQVGYPIYHIRILSITSGSCVSVGAIISVTSYIFSVTSLPAWYAITIYIFIHVVYNHDHTLIRVVYNHGSSHWMVYIHDSVTQTHSTHVTSCDCLTCVSDVPHVSVTHVNT